jgi:hypothetical protein
MSAQTFCATLAFVAGDDLYLHVEDPEARERVLRVSLRAIDEGEKARQLQAPFIIGAQGRAPIGDARRDRDHTTAGGELALEHGLRSCNDGRTAGEHRLGCALDDHLSSTVLLDQDRG